MTVELAQDLLDRMIKVSNTVNVEKRHFDGDGVLLEIIDYLVVTQTDVEIRKRITTAMQVWASFKKWYA